MTQAIEVSVGSRYGKWTILRESSKLGHNRRVWCRCECGIERSVILGSLIIGKSKTCGNRGCKRALPKGEAAFRHVLRQYVYGAKGRGFVWSLTDDEFRNLTSSPCHYCGEPPCKSVYTDTLPVETFNGDYPHTGIDRKDNAIGYTSLNCVPCCRMCNYRKLGTPYEEFVAWIRKISQHWMIV